MRACGRLGLYDLKGFKGGELGIDRDESTFGLVVRHVRGCETRSRGELARGPDTGGVDVRVYMPGFREVSGPVLLGLVLSRARVESHRRHPCDDRASVACGRPAVVGLHRPYHVLEWTGTPRSRVHVQSPRPSRLPDGDHSATTPGLGVGTGRRARW